MGRRMAPFKKIDSFWQKLPWIKFCLWEKSTSLATNRHLWRHFVGHSHHRQRNMQSSSVLVKIEQNMRCQIESCKTCTKCAELRFEVLLQWKEFHGKVAVTYRFPSDHRSQALSNGISIWMGDHPETPRAVGNTWCTRHMVKPRPQVGRVCQFHLQNTPHFTATKYDWSLDLSKKKVSLSIFVSFPLTKLTSCTLLAVALELLYVLHVCFLWKTFFLRQTRVCICLWNPILQQKPKVEGSWKALFWPPKVLRSTLLVWALWWVRIRLA